MKDKLRRIPSVDAVLKTPPIQRLLAAYPRKSVLRHVQKSLQTLREKLKRKEVGAVPAIAKLSRQIAEEIELAERSPAFSGVVNATGVIVHTGLGRAPLAEEAMQAIADTAGRYLSLELDLETGARGSRQRPFQELLCGLTGAEAALVVNNNAAAVMLALETLARGREVIVSRSELVEIGGSFRMPEIMEKSGARLVAVGTTNKARADDYQRAITSETALLLKVHQSNFRIVGFTEGVELAELVGLGREFGLPVMHDVGSGAFLRMEEHGMPHEPVVHDSIRAGVDIVTFSADKLLGGPQGGIVLGKKEVVAALATNPLARALRPGKLTLAALEATLKFYWDDKRALQKLPVFQMMTASIHEIEKRATQLLKSIRDSAKSVGTFTIEDGLSTVGGGSLPGEEIPTKVVGVAPHSKTVEEVAHELRMNQPPIVGRIHEGKLLLDMRTVFPEQIEVIADALRQLADK